MSARRAARDHRPKPAMVLPAEYGIGDLPRVFRVLACVEVWGPGSAPVPDGLDQSASAYFERASEVYWHAEKHVRGLGGNVGGHGPLAWSVDGRARASGRLRPLLPDSIDPAAQLAEAGCTIRDLPALRAEARELLYAASDTTVQKESSS